MTRHKGRVYRGGVSRIYNHERYVEFSVFPIGSKSNALKMARSLNKDGIKTRIVKASIWGKPKYVVLYRQKDWRKM